MKPKQILALTAAMAIAPALFADAPAEAAFKSKCGKCHTVTVAGKKVGSGNKGPDLSGYAAKRPADFLRLYSSDPAAARKQFPAIYAKEIKPKRDDGTYKKDMERVKDLSPADLEKILKLMK